MGRRDLIDSVALQHQDMDVWPETWMLRGRFLESGRLPGPPLQGIGRPLKVGKEEIAGLVAAVRAYLQQDLRPGDRSKPARFRPCRPA